LSFLASISFSLLFACFQNQFFISGFNGDGTIQNRVLEALYSRILQAHKQQKCFRVIVVLPLLPGFQVLVLGFISKQLNKKFKYLSLYFYCELLLQGGLDDGGAATVRALTHWQYRTISREKHSILHKLNVILGPKTHDYISFFGLRSYGRLFDGGPVATSQVMSCTTCLHFMQPFVSQIELLGFYIYIYLPFELLAHRQSYMHHV